MSRARTQALIGSVLARENEEGEAVLDGEVEIKVPGEGEVIVEVEPLTTEGTEGEAVAEMEEEHAEVEDVAGEVETMQENVEALEALAADLEVSLKNGGMTPAEAVMFNRAHVAIAGRHLSMKKRTLAAESFGSASSRLQATQAAHESVMDSIKAFIKGIIEFVKNLVAKVVNWFKTLFSSKERLKKRIAALEKAVANQGSELKEKNAKLKVPEGLTLDGKAPNGAALVSGFADLVKHANSLADGQIGAAKAVAELKGKVSKKVADAAETVRDIVDSFGESDNVGEFDKSALAQTQVGNTQGQVLGSKAFVLTTVKKGTVEGLTPATALSLIGVKLVDVKSGLKMAEKLETAPLATKESLAILKHIGDICDARAMNGEEYQKVSKAVDDVLEALETTAGKAKEDQKGAATAIRSTASGLQGMISNMGSGLLKCESYIFQRAQLGANLVAANVKLYK